jgi:hypothetical protein
MSATTKTARSGTAFLRSLRPRGLAGVALVIPRGSRSQSASTPTVRRDDASRKPGVPSGEPCVARALDTEPRSRHHTVVRQIYSDKPDS